MSSGTVVSRYLPHEARVLLLTELVDEGRFNDVVELLDSTGLEIPYEMGKNIFEVIKTRMLDVSENQWQDLSQDAEMRTLAQVTCKMDVVREMVEQWIGSQLVDYIKNIGDNDFSQEMMCDFPRPQEECEAVVLLAFLELVYLFSSKTHKSKLDGIIMLLLGCEDEIVTSKCSKLMRWHINDIIERCKADQIFDRNTWDLIDRVLSGDSDCPWKQRNGLSFLLRFLVASDPTPALEKFIQRDEYWMHVRAALSQKVHEYRKLGISVLQLTVKKISTWPESFYTSLISWDPLHASKFVQSWKEFMTLYEIVSLDTALNQIEAASGGILKLLDEGAFLNPSWGLILFSTGLRASMESVRKYMVSLLFQVRDKSVFATDLTTLRAVFLPSIMEAHFFNSDGADCPYGEHLANFISAIITESAEQADVVVEAMLETLVDQGGSFDPARIYISLGILNSLRKKNARLLNANHLELITKLFEFENEDAVFETTIQTIYLKFLLHVSPSVTPIEWAECIVSHIKRNQGSYEFFSPMAGLFEDFALTYFGPDAGRQLLGRGQTYELIAIILWKYDDVPVTRDLLIEVARSGENVPVYTENATEYLAALLNGKEVNYECTHLFVDYPGFSTNTWKSIDLKPLYESVTQEFSGDKLKFFVEVYKKIFKNTIDSFELSWPQLKDLYELIKERTSSCTLVDFKTKDDLYGVYFDLLSLCLKINPLKDRDEVNEFISMLENNVRNDNGNFKGDQGTSELCAYFLTTYVSNEESQEAWSYVYRIFGLLTTIWDSFSAERLVLKQRDLHLSTINGLFHPSVLLFSSFPSKEGKKLADKQHEYSRKIVKQAYSRRSMLPLMGQNIKYFMHLHGKQLQQNDDYWWLIDTMIAIFTCTQTTVNIFQIKTVIATLFDKKIGAYHSGSSGLYERTYGIEESSAKIDVITALLQSSDHFKDRFVSETINRTNLLVAKKKTDGVEEIQRLLEWQLILLCVSTQEKANLVDTAARFVLPNLVEEISPIIRIYMEWLISLSLSENYGQQDACNLEDKIFSLMDDHARPIVVVSAERIIYLVLKALKFKKATGFTSLLSKFTSKVVPNATSNKPLVRHFSNSLMLDFWPSFQETFKDTTLKGIIKGLFDKAESTKMSGRYRAGDANFWDINADLTLIGIFGGVMKKTIDHDLPFISEKKFKQYLPSTNLFPVGQDESSLWLLKRSTNRYAANMADMSSESTQLQTKSGAWETLMDIDSDTPDKNVTRSDLIVVSSLVDKPPNLGGICRLCDVLGVGLLAVQDIRVKNHPQFKNVAVTADRWMPMAEVSIQGIADFMQEKKKEGYVLIGLEQTDNSVKLDTHYKFPKKSLILLGTEAHGIPGDLLSQLDLCLEIQQFGVIRSMNIQTATAVIVHSYTIQHM